MIISATLTNRQGCIFDNTSYSAFSRDAGMKAAKRWAARRGGRYTLTLWDSTHAGYRILLEDFRYSGKCRNGVMV